MKSLERSKRGVGSLALLATGLVSILIGFGLGAGSNANVTANLDGFVPVAAHRSLQSRSVRHARERDQAIEQAQMLERRNLDLNRTNVDLDRKLAASLDKTSRATKALADNRAAVAGVTGSISQQMNKAIVRNAGSVGSGMIPIFGDAADAAATAVDVAEYCQISRDLDSLNTKVGNQAPPRSANLACGAIQDNRWPKWPRFKWPWRSH